MAVYERSLEIAAPPQRIWAYLSDFNNWEKLTETRGWLSKSSSRFRLAEGSAPGENAVVLVEGRGQTAAWVIRDWVPLRQIAIATQDKRWLAGYTAAIAFAIEPKTSLATHVTLRCRLEPAGFLLGIILSLSAPLCQKRAEAAVQATLDRLRATLE